MRGDEFFMQVAQRPPFTKLHPKVAAFLKDYFAREKVIRFGDGYVVNTHFPPYPSRAFDHLAEGFAAIGKPGLQQLYSVTLAVTNRCMFNCWHCYNAGRSQIDLPLQAWMELARELQDRGAVMVVLTGGEPLLRADLERIVGSFDPRSCVTLGTTGAGLTPERARRLRDQGLFALAVSLDSADEAEHDRLRGKAGAFRIAVEALRAAREEGLYPYVVSVATHDFLKPEHFWQFLRRARDCGALEVHLLEPSATGRLAGRTDVLLEAAERRQILAYQQEVADDELLPILSTYTYLEGPDAFGCGAGMTHLYVDGSGEVCPCQQVPLSFGNVAREPFGQILARMGQHFRGPRAKCAGKLLAAQTSGEALPTSPGASADICSHCLVESNELPRFFEVRVEATEEVGRDELRQAYDRIHDDYDDFWLSEAARPIEDLLGLLSLRRYSSVFEAGCGTGYATVRLAGMAEQVLAVDISPDMLALARRRAANRALHNVRWQEGDALETLRANGPYQLVFSSWVLGYVPLAPFFAAAARSLASGGRLAFVVHKENSPREPLEIFAQIIARDPSALLKKVAFDFPRDLDHVRKEMAAANLRIERLWEGAVVFRYLGAQEVLDHLLKSGAGTAFYDAVDPARREALTDEFLGMLERRHAVGGEFPVQHDYVACVAVKP